ncbi:MAG: hypothetical protein JST54_15765 [Deltaproteobacteria bacterium]|nr:hypothetical protein [Deltaproteobacteria bacterium]
MKTKLIAAMAVLTGAAVASFQACSSTQPHSSCFVQGGDVGTPFAAKYTITANNGCTFFGTHKDANGNNVSAEPIGVTLMGKNPNFVVAMLPLSLSAGSPAGDAGIPATGAFNGDPTVCAAPTMSPATAIIVDPNSQDPATFPQALFFGDGGCGPEDGGAATYDDGGAFDCNFEADGGPGPATTTSTSGSGSTGSSTAASSSGSGSTGSTAASSSSSSGSTGTTSSGSGSGSTGTTSSGSGSGSGGSTGSGLAICGDCTADTDCASGFCNLTAAPTGFCDVAAPGCTADADCAAGSATCDTTAGVCQCPQIPPPTPYVQATYQFSNVKFVQAGNVAGTQFSADLTYKQVALTANATSCDATIHVDAVWYNNSSSSSSYPDGGTPTNIFGPQYPDGGAKDFGPINNHCDVDQDCIDAVAGGLFNLPGDGSAFECLQVIPTGESPETMWDGGTGLPNRCVPKASVPAGATDCYTNCGG